MKKIQIILSAGLILCLADMPYGYYNLIRYASCIVFGIMAVDAYKNEKNSELIGYVAFAILFQPFIKIALGREIWQFFDVIAAIVLLIPIIKSYIKK